MLNGNEYELNGDNDGNLIIKGTKVNVEKENESCYFVGTGDCKVAELLGLSRCDKYYYEGKFDKNQVELVEEKKELKL